MRIPECLIPCFGEVVVLEWVRFRFSLRSMRRLSLLGVLLAAITQLHASPAFLSEVDVHFKAWDADHDGVLSVTEIEQGVASPEFKGPAAAAIASLRRAVRTKEYQLPPLTLEGIQKLVPKPKDRADLPDLEQMFDAALSKIKQGSSELMVPAKLGLDCLEQGKLGDCFCLAPMGAMLNRNPADVARMFATTNDGFVSVAVCCACRSRRTRSAR